MLHHSNSWDHFTISKSGIPLCPALIFSLKLEYKVSRSRPPPLGQRLQAADIQSFQARLGKLYGLYECPEEPVGFPYMPSE